MKDDGRDIFKYLWKMANELEKYDWEDKPSGTIISRYASMINDRINNSGFSRSSDSLMLFDTWQLEEELKRRKESK